MHAIAQPFADAFVLGEPQRSDALTVYPIFGGAPGSEYVALGAALASGVTIRELADDGEVGSLRVANATESPVLLFEGEEILGARQNRIFDASVLVEPGTELAVPVSCVEEGRWDEEGHEQGFRAAPQVAFPTLRRARLAARLDVGQGRRPQHAVWDEVAARSERMGAESPTGAMHDLFEARRAALDEIAGPIERLDGQVGAVVVLAGGCAVLDLVGRPEVWAALHGRLVQGYALDALEALPTELTLHTDVAAFVEAALSRSFRRGPAVGSGAQLLAADHTSIASGLALDDELVQLSVFAR
jgi:hypothetical protein